MLASTLRFLASGDSIYSLHYSYLFGVTTASNIVSETCAAIWTVLQPEVLPDHLNQEEWLKIAADYENKWNFHNCVGSIDGKHINIQYPDSAGSMYFNYKHHHSVVLLAICDANYIFRFVDIGAYGRRSDGGIFKSSVIGRRFEEGQMNLPNPRPISDVRNTPLPYCIVGDEAFPLKSYLLRPYPGKDGEFSCKSCYICLHNWLKLQDLNNTEQNTYLDQMIHEKQLSKKNDVVTTPSGAFTDIHRVGANNSSHVADRVREDFCSYFNTEGAVQWQYDYI